MFLITLFCSAHKITYFQWNINIFRRHASKSHPVAKLAVFQSSCFVFKIINISLEKCGFANISHDGRERSFFDGVSKHLRFQMNLSNFYPKHIAFHVFHFSSFFENVTLVATRATFLPGRQFSVSVFEIASSKIYLSLMLFDRFWKTYQKTSRFLTTFWLVVFDLEFVTFDAFRFSRVGATC